MVKRVDSKKARLKRHKRIRGKISGTASCPRLAVFRSLSNIYAQLIDDTKGVTLLKIAPIVTLDNVIKGLKKTLPERHHHLIPMNEEAIKRGMELIKEV